MFIISSKRFPIRIPIVLRCKAKITDIQRLKVSLFTLRTVANVIVATSNEKTKTNLKQMRTNCGFVQQKKAMVVKWRRKRKIGVCTQI